MPCSLCSHTAPHQDTRTSVLRCCHFAVTGTPGSSTTKHLGAHLIQTYCLCFHFTRMHCQYSSGFLLSPVAKFNLVFLHTAVFCLDAVCCSYSLRNMISAYSHCAKSERLPSLFFSAVLYKCIYKSQLCTISCLSHSLVSYLLKHFSIM